MSKKCQYKRTDPDTCVCVECGRVYKTRLAPERVHTYCGIKAAQTGKSTVPKKPHENHRRDVANLTASSYEMARRVAICEGCEQFNGYQCRSICVSCNGYAKWKRAVREGTCPEGRWAL